MTFLQILQTTLFLSFLVLFHEVGHFIAARLFGWEVEEFGIGYPPRLIGKKIKGTIFSINLIPFGGFCGFSEDEMYSRPRWQQAGVIFSGILFNFILGWFFLSILFAAGNPYIEGKVSIEDINPGSPAAEVGIVEGSLVVSVDGSKVKAPNDVIFSVQKQAGKEVVLTLKDPDSGEATEVTLVPRKDPPEGEGAMGVKLGFEGEEKMEKVSVFAAPVRGFEESISVLDSMVSGVSWMLRQLIFSGRVPKEVAGPVGVYDMTAQATMLGFRYLLQFLAFLSLNLALLNIFPLPALDGGQLVFVAIESIRGKRVRSDFKQLVNAVGMALLALLAILVTIQDVRRLL